LLGWSRAAAAGSANCHVASCRCCMMDSRWALPTTSWLDDDDDDISEVLNAPPIFMIAAWPDA